MESRFIQPKRSSTWSGKPKLERRFSQLSWDEATPVEPEETDQDGSSTQCGKLVEKRFSQPTGSFTGCGEPLVERRFSQDPHHRQLQQSQDDPVRANTGSPSVPGEPEETSSQIKLTEHPVLIERDKVGLEVTGAVTSQETQQEPVCCGLEKPAGGHGEVEVIPGDLGGTPEENPPEPPQPTVRFGSTDFRERRGVERGRPSRSATRTRSASRRGRGRSTGVPRGQEHNVAGSLVSPGLRPETGPGS